MAERAIVKFTVAIEGPIGLVEVEADVNNKNALKRVLSAMVDDYYLHAMRSGHFMHMAKGEPLVASLPTI